MSGRKKREVDPNAEPFLVFRYCLKKCFNCASCGYFWGPDHKEWAGKPASWPKKNGYAGSIPAASSDDAKSKAGGR